VKKLMLASAVTLLSKLRQKDTPSWAEGSPLWRSIRDDVVLFSYQLYHHLLLTHNPPGDLLQLHSPREEVLKRESGPREPDVLLWCPDGLDAVGHTGHNLKVCRKEQIYYGLHSYLLAEI
jgi:hypothetical protein